MMTTASPRTRSLILILSIWISRCQSWGSFFSASPSKTMNDSSSLRRRHLVKSILLLSSSTAPKSAIARNLPVSNGADLSKVGTIDSLLPIVSLRYSLSILDTQISNQENVSVPQEAPTREESFKRIFDAYSNPVSYKQKFLDQNAFLVYYTKGFDGPGRPKLEEDVNAKQTLQFGYRNEAWVSYESFLSELQFIEDVDNDAKTYLKATLQAVDRYLDLAPTKDIEEAKKILGVSW